MGESTAEMKAARRVLLRLAEVGHQWSTLIHKVTEGEHVVDNVALIVMCRLQSNEALRPYELQESLGLTSGGVSKLIDRLEEAGLVARLAVKPPEDGRGVQIVLTKKGHIVLSDVLAALAPSVHQVSADLVQILADAEGESAQR